MKHTDSEQGVSLIELLVAVAILAVALTPLLGIFLQALKTTEHAHKRTIALNLGRDMSEEIRSKNFKDPSIGPTGVLTFGLETAGMLGDDTYSAAGTRQLLDDVDDYDHWCRGQDCTECENTTAYNGLCVDNSPLEVYDGTDLTGPGYTQYDGFTRKVRVYAIFPNVSTAVRASENRQGSDPPEHRMTVGLNNTVRSFKFYDLRENNFRNLTGSGARSAKISNNGTGSSLRIVEVEVTYRGPVTPPVTIKDTAFVSTVNQN